MSLRVIQPIPYWAKLSHVHRIKVAFKSKDLDNFILHFLYLSLDQKGMSQYEKPITGIIEGLTGWPRNSIYKAMKRLETDGEFLRIGTKAVQINEETANRQRWQVIESRYTGKKPEYTEAQLQLAEKLREYIPHNSAIFNSEEEDVQQLKHDLRETRVALGETKVELGETKNELAKVKREQEEMKEALDLLMSRAKAEDAEEASTIITRHLKLVE